MVKRFILLAVATLFFSFQVFVNSASAGIFDFFKFGNSASSSSSTALPTEIPEGKRTLAFNEAGETVVVTSKDYKQGKKLFTSVCSQCHLEGITKTDFNVGLDLESLAGAEPARDNIESLIDYMKHPTSYDGEVDISELHPSKDSQNIFREMRNLTEDDLYALASFILIEPQVNPKWGGGKTIR